MNIKQSGTQQKLNSEFQNIENLANMSSEKSQNVGQKMNLAEKYKNFPILTKKYQKHGILLITLPKVFQARGERMMRKTMRKCRQVFQGDPTGGGSVLARRKHSVTFVHECATSPWDTENSGQRRPKAL